MNKLQLLSSLILASLVFLNGCATKGKDTTSKADAQNQKSAFEADLEKAPPKYFTGKIALLDDPDIDAIGQKLFSIVNECYKRKKEIATLLENQPAYKTFESALETRRETDPKATAEQVLSDMSEVERKQVIESAKILQSKANAFDRYISNLFKDEKDFIDTIIKGVTIKKKMESASYFKKAQIAKLGANFVLGAKYVIHSKSVANRLKENATAASKS